MHINEDILKKIYSGSLDVRALPPEQYEALKRRAMIRARYERSKEAHKLSRAAFAWFRRLWARPTAPGAVVPVRRTSSAKPANL